MRIIHISDPHLSDLSTESFWRLSGKRKLGYFSWQRRRRFIHKRKILGRLIESIQRDVPDLIVISGDLVQIGQEGEIKEARSWLDKIGNNGTPILVVPGNHDIYQADSAEHVSREWQPYLRLPNDGCEWSPSIFQKDRNIVIGLSSATPQPFWSARGKIGRKQLENLEKLLKKNTDSFRCVVLHHPVARNFCARRKQLIDAENLASLLTEYRVELVLHGHLHRNKEYFLGSETRVYSISSASSASVDKPSCYRIFDIEEKEGGYRVETTLKTGFLMGGDAVTSLSDSWAVERARSLKG